MLFGKNKRMAKKDKVLKTVAVSPRGRKGRGSGLTKEQNDLFISYAKKTDTEILTELQSDYSKGLKLEQVEKNREKFGPNTFATKKKSSGFATFFSAFINPFSAILIVIAVLTVSIPLVINQQPNTAN